MSLELDPAIISENSFITLYDKRALGTEVALAESYLIPASAIVRLREVPKEESPSTILIPGYVEVPAPPSIGQFSVNYSNGILEFNSADVGDTISVSYNGRGSKVFATDVNKITYPLTPFYNKLDGIVPDSPAVPVFTFPNNVVINGDLDIKGDITVIESTIVSIFDPIITLNAGYGAPPAVDSGFEVDRGTGFPRPKVSWVEANSTWSFIGANTVGTVKSDGDLKATALTRLGIYTDATEATMVSGLGASDEGACWFNTTSKQAKMWNGSAIAILG